MTPQEYDKSQDWKGMDGATAFLLIERHAEGWNDVREMMNAWLRANTDALVAELKAENERLLAYIRDCIEHYEDARAELERIKAHEGSKA